MLRLLVLLSILIPATAITQQDDLHPYVSELTAFELDEGTTPTYHDIVRYYEQYADHPLVQIRTVGRTDSGHPLHEVVVADGGTFDRASAQANGKAVLLINNGIHAGEACGIDASMLLLKYLLTEGRDLLSHTVVVIVPVYNIGGCLNRGSYSRANQEGPEAHGFRGNAKNLDLNRDFVKCDSDNAKTFNKLFMKWRPQVFVDNHTSNGADYQYVITLIATQKDKLQPVLARYMQDEMLPELYASLEQGGYEMTPYVYSMQSTPDAGIKGFMDLPRYSSGYAALHHAISFMPETHMLKPCRDRVYSTLLFMKVMLQHIDSRNADIISAQQRAIAAAQAQVSWPLQYELDTTVVDTVSFKGYQAAYRPSEITGADRLYYDRSQPYEKSIPLYNTYKPTVTVTRPQAYIIPQAYQQVAELLMINGVELDILSHDTTMVLDMYYITDYQSRAKPYEGHYLHYGVQTTTKRQAVQYHSGDYVVYTDQPSASYLMHVLEPAAADSYFAWNYFDGILMQKEHYSPYVWEDTAAELLADDAVLRATFLAKKSSDKAFAESPRAQLDYIYSHSPYYESTYLRYPVGRVTR